MGAHRLRITLKAPFVDFLQGANNMKRPRLTIVIAAASLSIAAFSEGAAAQSKTRQEVLQELLQARHDGVIPSTKQDYPPSPALIERNKEIHRATVHGGEQSPMFDAHDERVTVR
ncbi:DUF4148 domain-containing protein [Burkholderia ubonensis]|uniref:DUF4148 domain-containing protein n=1 Tax=Burkholderia ubonensis TaxID=101571 RepID=UPI0038BA8A11